MTDFQNITLVVEGPVATITVDRPKALNALNPDTIEELGQAVDLIAANKEIRAVILTGGGEKAFVAGADIAAMADLTPEQAEIFSIKGSNMMRRLEKLPIPVIAAVNGFALGGGCELAMACDFIYASDNARFGQPEVNLGLVPGFGGTQRLTRKVPYGIAMELLTTGRMIKADEALRIGLVNRVVPQAELMDNVQATVKELLTKAPVAVSISKALVQSAPDTDIDTGLANESSSFSTIFNTEDFKEGVTAFLAKRPAEFKGK
jgi:enoyl-CoA hydratase